MAQVLVAVSSVQDGTMHDKLALDSPEIIANKEAWLTAQGIRMADTTRVQISYDDGDDFCRYREVTNDEKGVGMTGLAPTVEDALITTRPGHALFLPVADCVAAAFFDPVNGVLMLSHLGRHSLEQQGAYQSVMYLQQHYNAGPKDIQVWLSPAAGKESYPIFKLDNKGLKEVLYEQLSQAGVPLENIHDDPADTTQDDRYYSHSAYLKGAKLTDGRFAMVAMML